ncbi:MAG: PAS domain S-box protein [Firmicutes bacterium]|nr:PAS domain S-box protein [Bacillota bacterium]
MKIILMNRRFILNKNYQSKSRKRVIYRLILMLVISVVTTVMMIPYTTYSYADGQEKVTLQLRWNHQFQFAGYYVAKWMGYYDEEGLDVNIRSGFTKDGEVLLATEEVAGGRADFGIGGVDVLIAENSGENFTVIASIFQKSPVEFYMKEDTKYASLADLTKLNTARRKDDLLDIELQAMFISEGIQPDNSKFLNKNIEFAIDDLITGKYNVIPGYLGTISFYADKHNVDIKSIKPIDYGIDFYGDSLFTSRELALSNPDLVEKFRRASMKGWIYALEHPYEIAQKISKEFNINGKSEDELLEYNLFQAKRVDELTLYPVVEIGNINPFRWEKMQQALLELELIDDGVDLDKFIFDYEKINSTKTENTVKLLFVILVLCLIISICISISKIIIKNRDLRNEVSERERVESSIRKMNQRYETIFNSVLLGITVTTIEGVILQANDKWLDMIGYSEEEIVGRNIIEFISDDFRECQLEVINRFKEGDVKNYIDERKYIRKDGKFFWGNLFMTTTYDQNNEEKVNIGMVVDITNRKFEEEAVKRSEQRFRNIINEVAEEISEKEGVTKIFNSNNDFINEQDIINEKNRLSLKLEKINLELEKMFKKELDENKKKEALIIYQARLAAMGEMIANIAHQWRQPLNSLGLVLSNLEDAYRFNELTQEYLSNSIRKSKRLINKMSSTIDDFRSFLNPNQQKEDFIIYESINMVLELVEENLKFNNIKVKFNHIDMVKGYGLENQYSQAVFNIINNSIDALKNKSIKDKKIIISIYEKKDMVIADFEDNGGGIDKEVSKKVFDLYFTTKEKSGGTGLGLYMTKVIIENNMDGEISWSNTDKGLLMKIAIPKRGELNE